MPYAVNLNSVLCNMHINICVRIIQFNNTKEHTPAA